MLLPSGSWHELPHSSDAAAKGAAAVRIRSLRCIVGQSPHCKMNPSVGLNVCAKYMQMGEFKGVVDPALRWPLSISVPFRMPGQSCFQTWQLITAAKN
jgi:hypothetical protein